MPEHDFAGGVELTLVLAETPEGRPSMVFTQMEDRIFGNTLYNLLGEHAVRPTELIEIGVRTTGEGKETAHRLYVLRDGIEGRGAFGWDEEAGDGQGWFDGVPLPIDTGQKNGTRIIYDKRAACVAFRTVLVQALSSYQLWSGGMARPDRFSELSAVLNTAKKAPKNYEEILLEVRHDLLTFAEQTELLDLAETKFGEHGHEPTVKAGAEGAVAAVGATGPDGPASEGAQGEAVRGESQALPKEGEAFTIDDTSERVKVEVPPHLADKFDDQGNKLEDPATGEVSATDAPQVPGSATVSEDA